MGGAARWFSGDAIAIVSIIDRPHKEEFRAGGNIHVAAGGGVGVGLVARFASFVLYTVDRSREDNVIMLHHFLKSGGLLDRHLSFAS